MKQVCLIAGMLACLNLTAQESVKYNKMEVTQDTIAGEVITQKTITYKSDSTYIQQEDIKMLRLDSIINKKRKEPK